MEIGGGRLQAVPPPPHSLKHMGIVLGDMPPGDAPGAWWSSTYPQVTTAYDKYVADRRAWNDKYSYLLKQTGLPQGTEYVLEAHERLAGLVAPADFVESAQRWLRLHKNGTHLVPRRRTVAEKQGPVQRLWEELEFLPQPVKYVPGMPGFLSTEKGIFPVVLRKPASAVLAFVALPPEGAREPFEVSEHWSRMKISTFHSLRERQQDMAKQVT